MNAPPRYQPGDRIGGRYQVHQALTGGMGEVYLCLDLETIQPYALKTFQQRYQTDPRRLRQAFEREVATWVALEKHPNIVRCFYMDILDNQPFMALEWIAGEEGKGTDLRGWLRHGPLELRQALDFTIDICRGLLHAQGKQPGLVHRDLKPENLLIAQGGPAKITDFGLAEIILETDIETDMPEVQGSGRHGIVGRKGIAGTPAYMAPEQWRGERLDQRTDIYAVGCMLHEMVTGEQLFRAPYMPKMLEWPHEWFRAMQARHESPILSASSSGLPEVIDNLLRGCLAIAPIDRPASLGQLLSQLGDLYQELFTTSPPAVLSAEQFSAGDHNNRGLTYYNLDRYDEALADFNQALQLDPAMALVYSNRGNVYDRLGQYDEAIADYSRAIQLNSGVAVFFSNRGDTYCKLQRYDEALADLERALEVDSTYPPAYNNLGNCYVHLERYDEALEDFNRALQLDPFFVRAYGNRGSLHFEMHRYDEALTDFTKVIQLAPTDTGGYYHRARTYQVLQRYAQALADFTQVIQLTPTFLDAYYYRAKVYEALQQYDEALADFTRALEIDPAFAAGYNDRGVLLTRLQQYDEALTDLGRAIRLAPGDADINFNMGAILGSIELQRYGRLLADCEALSATAMNLMQAMQYLGKAIELSHPKAREWMTRLGQHLQIVGVHLNNLGYQALRADQFEKAQRLFEQSADVCRRIEDGEGEIMALENAYLAQRAAQRYLEALSTLEIVLETLLRVGFIDKYSWYLDQVLEAIEVLEPLGSVCTVRQTHYDSDLQSCLEKHNEGARILVLEDEKDVVEVMAHVPMRERQAFLARALKRVENLTGLAASGGR